MNADYAHWKTVCARQCVNRKGEPIPWYSYPAIEFIQQLDFSDKTVFEYGSGYSTIFWASRCRELTSIEHDARWYQNIQPKLYPFQADYRLITDLKTYAQSIQMMNKSFDVIIIDGQRRYACAVVARKHLAPGGMIILDNADWFVETAKYLRESGLIEVDMAGFSPINHYTLTTSIFLSRDFNIRSAHVHQPMPSIGAILNNDSEPHEVNP